MRELTKHHDGHGLNESIRIEAGSDGPGGAAHHYSLGITSPDALDRQCDPVWHLDFQEGPRNLASSKPGLTTTALIAILIDHLSGFQKGEFGNRETALAITKLEEAMFWLRARADERARRKVLGTYAK